MCRRVQCALVGLVSLVALVAAKVTLKPLSTIYLPSTFYTNTDPGHYEIGREAIKKFAYDEQIKIAYTIGKCMSAA